jgi:hypothetical protein
MPNWCLNEGFVRLPAEAFDDAKEVFAKLREGGDKWFANVFPTPLELSLGLNSTEGNSEYINLDWLRANSEYKGSFGKIKKHVYDNGNERLEFIPTKKYQQYLKDTFESDNWYSWNLENWGTKWDVTANTDFSANDNQTFYFSFDSAWGPPETFFENLSDRYGLEYELKYFESGVGFAGKVSYLNGKHSQTHVEGIDYYLFVINEFDEPIETAIYAVEDYSSYEEFIEAEPKFADNSELVSLIKQYYGYKNPPPAPVKKKASKKTAAKKKS